MAGMSPQAMQWLERFERYLSTERRLSPHTLLAYRRDLTALREWCARHSLQEWTDLDHQHIRSFAARSHARGLKGRSIQRRLAATAQFLHVSAARGRLQVAIRRWTCRAPKAAKRLPQSRWMSIRWRSCWRANPRNALEVRDLALMELFYSSGLRLS
jgi:integrase/recombinase XerC